jgi:hypothetical protein
MTWFSWLWIAWGALFVGTEATALIVKDRPGARATLTANVRWLTTSSGPWHTTARTGLGLLLAWLPVHFGYAQGGNVSNLDMWSALVGSLMPPVVAVANRPTWRPWVKGAVTIGSCLVAAVVTAYLNGTASGGDLTRSGLVVALTAVGTYRVFWRPSGIAPAIEKATSPAPPPAATP